MYFFGNFSRIVDSHAVCKSLLQSMKAEKDLVLGLKKGDSEALSMIYDQYYEGLYFYLLKFTSQKDLVQNAVQDLFVDLWASRSKLGEINSLKGYLFVSGKRKLYHLIKSNKKKQIVDLAFPTVVDGMLFQYSQEDFLVEIETNEERKDRLLTAINRLPSRQKEAIYLRYYEKLNLEEISQIQGIAYQSVLNNLQRALHTLRSNPLIVNLFEWAIFAFICLA
ncbi:RNA polymerase, sigma-24 subunit, ECF subfamily [Cyclobacterium marinum DSM 745]|uniref:RNA polymerase, sigma-24 subunit, ECF subfamily n=2 Tax=Cyclobacterium marinum TaxID=104 RepID=G0IUX2_CYCMS|nr:RNA polymerase, sigma-24 subunit, ECF subfamily [Cyclobacterium marinum DSM 745]|tara:strand:+ start:276 stop:941 length:666 start_codon:yes stop_codon:yes gene_type:complete